MVKNKVTMGKLLINDKNATKFTLWLIFISFIFRFILANWTGLGVGESYYYGGARFLQLSYYDQPPLFMWLSGGVIRLLGDSCLILRLPALVLFAGTSWILYLITRKFFNACAGFYTVLLLNVSGVFFLSGIWFQPDAPLMLFWIGYIYCLVQILFIDSKNSTAKSNDLMWWLLSGLMLGLTILSKYHAIFLVIGFILFLINSDQHRNILKQYKFYLSIFISLMIAFPVFMWNYQHHWASFLFQGGRALNQGPFQLHFDWFLRSILGQAVWTSLWIWIPLFYQLIESFRLRKSDIRYSFCFWMAITPIIFFTIVTLWADLQYHFHWQAPGYMLLFIPLGQWVHNKFSDPKYVQLIKYWLSFSIFIVVFLFLLLAIHTQTGFWTWYGPKWMSYRATGVNYDPTMEGYDYDDLMTLFKQKGWIDNPDLFVGTTHWWLSGKIDWALKGHKDILCFEDDARNYSYFNNPHNYIGKNGIIITKANDPLVKENVAPFCDNLLKLPDAEIKRRGVTEITLKLYECQNFHQPKDPDLVKNVALYRFMIGDL